MSTVSTMRRRLELAQRTRALVLDVAEVIELLEVGRVRALPRVVVGPTPPPRVLGRARVGEHRHRLVRPYAVPREALAPRGHRRGIVGRGGDEVRLHEGDAALRAHQQLEELAGRPAAPLGEQRTTLPRDALHAGFDGHAPG